MYKSIYTGKTHTASAVLYPKTNLDGKNFYFYTDGSMINHAIEFVAVAGAFIQVDKTQQTEISRSGYKIESFPSAFKGEMLAILLTLFTVPDDAVIHIFTDSLGAISLLEHDNAFNYTKKFNANSTLKSSSCMNIKMLMIELIRQKRISLRLHKVKAHSGNKWNDLTDSLVKEINCNENVDNVIIFNFSQTRMFDVLPKFVNLMVDSNPRSIIKYIQEVKSTSSFLNLNRNAKYRKAEINWPMTFALLQSDESNSTTSFDGQRIRRNRLRLMFEEVDSTQQLTKVYPAIYNEWPCVRCGLEIETFRHLWNCPKVQDEVLKIIDDAQVYLNGKINDCLHDLLTLSTDLWYTIEGLPIWKVLSDNDDYLAPLDFIGLLKGIIPEDLVNSIKRCGISHEKLIT